MRKWILAATLVAAAVPVGIAVATPASGVSAETVRGAAEPIKVNTKFDNGARVKIQTRGEIDFIVQRIVAEPGATFGWHSHPGENINVIKQGTLTLYHDEACTVGIPYGPGAVFTTSPDEIHLARNNGTEELILFATYFAPKTDPLVVRVDQDNPDPARCPQ